MLVPLDGALYVLDGVGEGSEPRRLFDPADARWAEVGTGPLLDPKISADGELVCFVWGDEARRCARTPESQSSPTGRGQSLAARGAARPNRGGASTVSLEPSPDPATR